MNEPAALRAAGLIDKPPLNLFNTTGNPNERRPMARISSFFANALPFLALCAIVAGFIPIVGPSLHVTLGHAPGVSWEMLGISAALIVLGFGYFWFESKEPSHPLKRAIREPKLGVVVLLLLLATVLISGLGAALRSTAIELFALVPLALMCTCGIALLCLWIIEDMAADSVPPYIQNRTDSTWYKRTQARWKQNFRNTCFIFGGAFGLTSLFLWGAGRYDPSATPSPEVFMGLVGAAVISAFIGWVMGSFTEPS